MLEEVENKYGEAIEMEDIDGVKMPPKTAPGALGSDDMGDEADGTKQLGEASLFLRGDETRKSTRRKPRGNSHTSKPTNTKPLPPFLKKGEKLARTLHGRDEKGQLADLPTPWNEKGAHEAYMAKRLEQAKKEEAEFSEQRQQVYIYSGQKLQYTELKKEEMRQALAQKKNTTYTYSKDHLSLAVQMVNEDKMKVDEERRNREKFMTKKGFVYPAPKPKSEYARPSRDISESRKEELRTEWAENENNPEYNKTMGRGEEALDEGRSGFDTRPAPPGRLFGGLDPSGTKADPNFYTSVINTPFSEAIEAKTKEVEEWKSKIIGDKSRPEFHVAGNTRSNASSRTAGLDKTRGMLRGEVHPVLCFNYFLL